MTGNYLDNYSIGNASGHVASFGGLCETVVSIKIVRTGIINVSSRKGRQKGQDQEGSFHVDNLVFKLTLT